MRHAQLSRKEATEILSNFVLIDIIRMNTTVDGTVFSLNHEFDKTELEKFG
jgi:hypothetical protein